MLCVARKRAQRAFFWLRFNRDDHACFHAISARGMRRMDLEHTHTRPSLSAHFRGSEQHLQRDHRLINQGNLSAQY